MGLLLKVLKKRVFEKRKIFDSSPFSCLKYTFVIYLLYRQSHKCLRGYYRQSPTLFSKVSYLEQIIHSLIPWRSQAVSYEILLFSLFAFKWEPNQQYYFHMVTFIRLYKVDLTSRASKNNVLWWYHLHEASLTIRLHGIYYLAISYRTNSCVWLSLGG